MMTEQVIILDGDRCAERKFSSLHPTILTSRQEVEDAVRVGSPRRILWIACHGDALAWLAHAITHQHSKRHDWLLLLTRERETRELLPMLMSKFDRVQPPSLILLPLHELSEVLAAPGRKALCIGGVVSERAGIVTLVRGDLSVLVVPTSIFEAEGRGPIADFTRFKVSDYGQTLCFGDYEASVDAVLYEQDPEYRRELKAQRLQSDQSFGASLRRLRRQKGLSRSDFPGISPKTIARIERGEVEAPHDKTLDLIAAALGVPPEEIEQY